jgi:hypothetical protein
MAKTPYRARRKFTSGYPVGKDLGPYEMKKNPGTIGFKKTSPRLKSEQTFTCETISNSFQLFQGACQDQREIRNSIKKRPSTPAELAI